LRQAGQEGRSDSALPHLHHWLLAALLLFVLTQTVPVFALFV
jgi:hypothetical protein